MQLLSSLCATHQSDITGKRIPYCSTHNSQWNSSKLQLKIGKVKCRAVSYITFLQNVCKVFGPFVDRLYFELVHMKTMNA